MSGPSAQIPESEEEKNITLLGTATPVAEKQLLRSPPETRSWVTLKEGYLLKTKFKKIHKSTKLRMFLLKQNPTSLAATLEYYEGFSFRGSANLENARIHPQKGGVFLVHTKNRTFHLQAERSDLRVATNWVLALQQAILSVSKNMGGLPAVGSASSSVSLAKAASVQQNPGAFSSPSKGAALVAGDKSTLLFYKKCARKVLFFYY